LSKAKVIAVDHNPRPLGGYPFKKKIEKRIKGVLFSRYIDVFVGVSDYTVDEIATDFGSHLRKKAMTIYNGVVIDAILIRNHRNEVKPTFLVASHLRESKGVQDLIDAVNLLPVEIKNEISIDVFGDGPFKKQLITKIEQYDLEKCFSFLGSKSNLNEIFCNYDYMLQPTHMECFSLSILESLAANVPVITTDVGGNEEVIHHRKNGFISKAGDIPALKAILEAIFVGNKKIVGNTRQLIEDCFSLEKMVDNHLALVLKNKL
jgi:glycosyltransferase involved in cell wall biosynthesis